jgi:molybdate transport system regulatory protein
MKKKEIRLRCWIDIDGVKFFGPGRAELLGLIEEAGSISKAAKKMGMSYKKAWDMVDEMNTRSNKTYVITSKGGKSGGGAELTEAAKKMLDAYQRLNRKLNDLVKKDAELLKLI